MSALMAVHPSTKSKRQAEERRLITQLSDVKCAFDAPSDFLPVLYIEWYGKRKKVEGFRRRQLGLIGGK